MCGSSHTFSSFLIPPLPVTLLEIPKDLTFAANTPTNTHVILRPIITLFVLLLAALLSNTERITPSLWDMACSDILINFLCFTFDHAVVGLFGGDVLCECLTRPNPLPSPGPNLRALCIQSSVRIGTITTGSLFSSRLTRR